MQASWPKLLQDFFQDIFLVNSLAAALNIWNLHFLSFYSNLRFWPNEWLNGERLHWKQNVWTHCCHGRPALLWGSRWLLVRKRNETQWSTSNSWGCPFDSGPKLVMRPPGSKKKEMIKYKWLIVACFKTFFHMYLVNSPHRQSRLSELFEALVIGSVFK